MSVAAPLWFWKFWKKNSRFWNFFLKFWTFWKIWKLWVIISKVGSKFWRWEGYIFPNINIWKFWKKNSRFWNFLLKFWIFWKFWIIKYGYIASIYRYLARGIRKFSNLHPITKVKSQYVLLIWYFACHCQCLTHRSFSNPEILANKTPSLWFQTAAKKNNKKSLSFS